MSSGHDSYPQLAFDAQLCFPLYATSRAVTRTYGELLADVGLTYPQYLSLLALWDAEDPMTVGELGVRLRLDSGTLTPVLKRLEAAGYVERRRDPEDERRVLLDVTPQGWALQDRVADVPSRLGAAMALSEQELLELRDRLDGLLENLEARAD